MVRRLFGDNTCLAVVKCVGKLTLSSNLNGINDLPCASLQIIIMSCSGVLNSTILQLLYLKSTTLRHTSLLQHHIYKSCSVDLSVGILSCCETCVLPHLQYLYCT